MAGTSSGGEARALATLALQKGPAAGTEHPVRQPSVSIGRGSQNEVVLDDDSVSTTHARLEYEHGAWRITDLGSTNGTFVEGVRLAPEVPTPLAFGSSVRFGSVHTHFRPVPGADPDAARAAYEAPAPARRLAERSSGFRLPLWVLLLVLAVLLVAALWFGWASTAGSRTAPAPTPASGAAGAALLPHHPAPA